MKLQEVVGSGERLPLARALALVRAVAFAVDALHAHQLVHGSLSLAAIQLDGDDHVTLVPASRVPQIAGSLVVVPDAADLPPGAVGVLDIARAYWSPQRLAGEPARRTDDLYALGLVARAVLAGSPDCAAALPLPAEIEAVLEAQRSWAPSGRFASGAEFARELERAAEWSGGRQVAPNYATSHLGLARSEPEPAWAAARRVALAREAHRLALAEQPYRQHRERTRTIAHHPVQRRDYPDFPLPGGWVAVLVVVLCSVYLFPLYFIIFPHG